MANQNAKIDDNRRKTLLGVTDDVAAEIRRLIVDPTTGALKCSFSGTITGNVIITGTFTPQGISKFPDGSVSAPSITWATDTSAGLYHSGTGATGSILAAINGVKKAEVTATVLKTTGISVVIGAAALATSATDGFLYIPTCAGTPTGVPTAQTGTVAMVYDTTNHRLYVYDGGWV